MKTLLLMTLIGTALAWLAALRMDTNPTVGPADVSFRRDVLPILDRGGCTGCHGDNGGLDLTSVRALLAGGEHGPAVVPGHADSSILIRWITPDPPFGPMMPPEGNPLPGRSVGVIRAWIDRGAGDN